MYDCMIVCSRCGAPSDGHWKCRCGGPLEVREERKFRTEELRPVHSMWRYEPYLGTERRVSLGEGGTPLVVDEYCYKLDYLFPTGSFKDRGTAVMMSNLLGQGITSIVEDSSGNAGASVAAYAARAGIKAEICVPHYASEGKIAQIEAFGAKIWKVKGTRDDARKKALERAEKVYYASHQWNPHFLEGMKTVAYECAEQMKWETPDAVILPVGSGSLYYGMYKGFNHLYESGVTSSIPHLVGVQTEACHPVYSEVHDLPRSCGKSAAEGLLVENPPRLKEIKEVIRKYGDIILVSEEEIVEGLKKSFTMGLYIEPTSAVVVAALEKLNPPDGTVVILTGSGLKATDTVRQLMRG